MAAQAGHEVKVYAYFAADTDSAPASNEISSYTEIGGIDSISFNEERMSLDKTDFKSTSGAMEYFLGLKNGTVGLSGFYDSSDSGQDELRSAFDGSSAAVCWICVAWTGTISDGTTQVKTVVTNFNREIGVQERVNLSVDCQFNGAPAAGPTS